MTVQDLLDVLNLSPSDAEVVLRDKNDRVVSLKSVKLGGIWTGGTKDPDRPAVIITP